MNESTPDGITLLRGVRTADARAWANYIRTLRAEIAQRKAAGRLPPELGAPEPVYRTLLDVLAAIDALPSAQPTADLALPAGRPLQVWAFYTSAAHTWADDLVADGVLTIRRPAAAERFWAQIEELAEVPGRLQSSG
ncbi:MAG: hypothetical protein M3N52_04815 [Actinomycetota bacterium]|nr:hypothetical protein [Actinomycetota bacterium]